jgi:prepilin-type N-terminal cleavage/methylation domain-containing protein
VVPDMRARGFTLVEVIFAISVLAIGTLMLSAAIASSCRMSAIARERAIANNAIRAYIERMRQQYPVASADGNMLALIQRGMTTADGNAGSDFTTPDGPVPDSTPIFDLMTLHASGAVERSALKGATAKVWWVTDETGNSWGPALTASIDSRRRSPRS